MVIDAAGRFATPVDSARRNAEDITALRQAAKDCYCGLGPACCHWDEMTYEQKIACSSDKRAAAEALWRNGTVG